MQPGRPNWMVFLHAEPRGVRAADDRAGWEGSVLGLSEVRRIGLRRFRCPGRGGQRLVPPALERFRRGRGQQPQPVPVEGREAVRGQALELEQGAVPPRAREGPRVVARWVGLARHPRARPGGE